MVLFQKLAKRNITYFNTSSHIKETTRQKPHRNTALQTEFRTLELPFNKLKTTQVL